MPGWLPLFCVGLIAVGVFNVWRFRSGWRFLGRYYRPGLTETMIGLGYASVPLLVASVAMLILTFSFPYVAEHPTTVNGYAFLLCGVLFVASTSIGWKESRRPSHWNKAPAWLEEARERGEL